MIGRFTDGLQDIADTIMNPSSWKQASYAADFPQENQFGAYVPIRLDPIERTGGDHGSRISEQPIKRASSPHHQPKGKGALFVRSNKNRYLPQSSDLFYLQVPPLLIECSVLFVLRTHFVDCPICLRIVGVSLIVLTTQYNWNLIPIAEAITYFKGSNVTYINQALTLGLWVQWPGGPVDLKTYWPPKKRTGPGGQ